MNETKLIELTAEETRALKWIHRASGKVSSNHPLYKTININEHNIESCDGFRVHSIEDVYIEGFDGVTGTYKIDKPPAKGYNVIQDANHCSFPDTNKIKEQLPDKPVFEICVNPKLLMEACQDQEGQIKLTFYGDDRPFEMRGNLKGDALKTYALIMPMKES